MKTPYKCDETKLDCSADCPCHSCTLARAFISGFMQAAELLTEQGQEAVWRVSDAIKADEAGRKE